MAEKYMEEAKTTVINILPPKLQSQIAKLKHPLLEAKMRGVDISDVIGLMKETNRNMKHENYFDALNALSHINSRLEKLGISV